MGFEYICKCAQPQVHTYMHYTHPGTHIHAHTCPGIPRHAHMSLGTHICSYTPRHTHMHAHGKLQASLVKSRLLSEAVRASQRHHTEVLEATNKLCLLRAGTMHEFPPRLRVSELRV